MHQLEGFLDHFRRVADHIEHTDRVGQFGADGHQPCSLASAAGDLVEHRPIRQRAVAFTALDTPGEQAPFQVLATHGRPPACGELPLHFGGQAHKTEAAVVGRSATPADRQQLAVVFHQPGAVHRREALGFKARQLDLGQTPGHAAGRIARGRRFATGQRLRLGHHLGVLARGHFVLADEVQHRLERGLGVGLRHQGRDDFIPVFGQVLEAELAVDEVAAIAGNKRLLITRLALAERIAKADLAVIQRALRQHIGVAEHHIAFARQRQADVARQRLGVVELIAGFIGPGQ